jgi:hypothetical protein
MSRFVWIVLVLVLLGFAGGFLALGAFPPRPHVETIQKVLPNDRFQSRT